MSATEDKPLLVNYQYQTDPLNVSAKLKLNLDSGPDQGIKALAQAALVAAKDHGLDGLIAVYRHNVKVYRHDVEAGLTGVPPNVATALGKQEISVQTTVLLKDIPEVLLCAQKKLLAVDKERARALGTDFVLARLTNALNFFQGAKQSDLPQLKANPEITLELKLSAKELVNCVPQCLEARVQQLLVHEIVRAIDNAALSLQSGIRQQQQVVDAVKAVGVESPSTPKLSVFGRIGAFLSAVGQKLGLRPKARNIVVPAVEAPEPAVEAPAPAGEVVARAAQAPAPAVAAPALAGEVVARAAQAPAPAVEAPALAGGAIVSNSPTPDPTPIAFQLAPKVEAVVPILNLQQLTSEQVPSIDRTCGLQASNNGDFYYKDITVKQAHKLLTCGLLFLETALKVQNRTLARGFDSKLEIKIDSVREALKSLNGFDPETILNIQSIDKLKFVGNADHLCHVATSISDAVKLQTERKIGVIQPNRGASPHLVWVRSQHLVS